MADEKKHPVDALVELAVFAPLGLALTARDNLPELIAKGRTQVTGQVNMARMIGQFAVTQGEKDLRKRLEGVAETLSALGILPASTPVAPPAPTPPATTTEPTAAPAAATAPSDAPRDAPVAAVADATAAPSSGDLAIPGYDTLSASQVVQRLAGLAPEELEAVRAYEAGSRGRRTILSKVAQLQSGSGR